jgi:hypothetical protein
MAISMTAIRIKSGFSRISRCRGPGMGCSVTAGFDWDGGGDCAVEEGPTEGYGERPEVGDTLRARWILYVCIWIEAVNVLKAGPDATGWGCSRRAVVVGFR